MSRSNASNEEDLKQKLIEDNRISPRQLNNYYSKHHQQKISRLSQVGDSLRPV